MPKKGNLVLENLIMSFKAEEERLVIWHFAGAALRVDYIFLVFLTNNITNHG